MKRMSSLAYTKGHWLPELGLYKDAVYPVGYCITAEGNYIGSVNKHIGLLMPRLNNLR